MPFQPRPGRAPIVINIPNRTPMSSSPSSDPMRRRVIGWFVALTTAGVLFCGMFPFDFVFHFSTAGDDFRRRFDWTIDQLYTAGDGLENIVFFMPTGFALAAVLIRRQRPGSTVWANIGRAAAIAIPLGATLSTLVECSQVYLQSRDPSLADICSNTTGTAVGFGLFLFIGSTVIGGLTRVARRLDAWLIPVRCRIIAIAWLAIAATAPLLFHHAGSLGEWNPTLPLLLGNETTGDRWWNGNVKGLWIADHAINDLELERILGGADVPTTIGSGLESNYEFVGRGPYFDKNGNAGPLHWKQSIQMQQIAVDSRPTTGPGELVPPLVGTTTSPIAQPLGRDWWLQTENNAFSSMANRIKKSQSFTLICDVQTDDLDQRDGPPRIVSISAGTTLCNLQLLQEGDELVVRLRTVASGEGGSDPEFILPDVFIDPGPRRIAVRYDHDELMVTTNQIGDHDRFRFTPEASLIWQAYPRPGWAFRLDSSGQNACAEIYRLLAMFPIALFLAKSEAMRSSIGRLIVLTALSLAVLELSLAIQSGYAPSFTTVAAAALSAIAGFVIAGRCKSMFAQLRKRITLW